MILISESAFYARMTEVLASSVGFRSVSGPGRSGAIAAVYASRYLGVPMIPAVMRDIPAKLRPLLIIDTAQQSGRTLRALARRMRADQAIAIYREPPRLRFWYEEEGRKARSREVWIRTHLPTIIGRLRTTLFQVALARTGQRSAAMSHAIGETSKAYEWLGIEEPRDGRHRVDRLTRADLFAEAERLDGKSSA